MATEIGEYAVGAYLKLIEGCDIIEYNAKPLWGGNYGQTDFDVIGCKFENNLVFICEVKTHLDKLCIGSNNDDAVKKINNQFEKKKQYAEEHFKTFEIYHMLWSPVVKVSLVNRLNELSGLELIINDEYTKRISKLIDFAKKESNIGISDIGNPFFRALQLLQTISRNAKNEDRKVYDEILDLL